MLVLCMTEEVVKLQMSNSASLPIFLLPVGQKDYLLFSHYRDPCLDKYCCFQLT